MNETVDTAGSEFDLEEAVRNVTYRPETRLVGFRALSLDERSAVFIALSDRLRQDILEELTFSEALELLDHLDPLRVHQILVKMKDKKRRERFLSRLKNDRFEKTEYFLSFHPEASTSLFHLNYLYVPDTTTVGETAEIIERHLKTTGKVPAVLVSENGKLAGEVSLGVLVREPNRNKIRNYVRPVASIAYNAKKEEALSFLIATPHEKVVVTDTDGSVLGLIYSDDVIDLLGDDPASTLYSFAGVEASERPFDGIWNKVKGRYRWLIVNLVTCFMAGGVVSIFEGTIDRFVALAIFIPIITGMGGNASTQTLAVMIRGIAIGEISLKNSYSAIMREVGAGLVNGVVTGAIMVPAALLFGLPWIISIVAAMAVIFNMVVAGLAGSFMPLILRYFGKDPATSAGIFISTATDVLGLLFFLGLATIVLL